MGKPQQSETRKLVSQVTRNRHIDLETGEVMEEFESTIFAPEREPNYVKLYLDQLVTIANLQGWTSKVLYELIGSTTYANEGQLVIVNAGLKRLVAEKLNIKTQTVTNAITALKNQNILIPKERGVFILNPQFFGKGEWKDISKLRYEISLSSKGAEVQLIEVEKETNTRDELNKILSVMPEEERQKLLKSLVS